MKIQGRKRKVLRSFVVSPERSDAYDSPSTSSKKAKVKKLGYDRESSSLVLLSNINKKLKMGNKVRKKQIKNRRTDSFLSSNWHVSPASNSSDDSNSSSDTNQSITTLNNLSETYKKHIEESLNFNLEGQPSIASKEGFNHMLEAAKFMSDVESDESNNNFFLQKKEEISSEIRPMHRKRNNASNITCIAIQSKNSFIVTMDHPAEVTLKGYVSVEVLTGTVSLYGHELKPQDIPVKVFSHKKTGFIQVTTESFDHLWMRKEAFSNLHIHLTKLTGSPKIARKVLSRFGNTTVAIVVTAVVLPRNLQVLQLYYPKLFEFDLKDIVFHIDMKHVFNNKISSPKSEVDSDSSTPVNPMNFGPDVEDLGSDIISAIRNSKLNESDGPRIIVYGSCRAGKSTLLRYLMNKALSMFPVVYYLDTDPGQTEFTPPGVVSLTAVKKPVFGPPFTHQRKPVLMCFTGSVSSQNSPDMYSKCVAKLAFLFKLQFIKEPLFINTMGWTTGVGFECLKNVMKSVSPTVVIEMLKSDDDELMFDYREYSSSNFQFHQILSKHSVPHTIGKPSLFREYSLLSYFGRCQLLHEKPNYLNTFKPFCVSWDNVSVYLFGNKIPPYRIVESINASVVALCRVDQSLILESSNPLLPKTLESEPENECLGYGIVRAIDEAKHLLYIVTPLPLDEVKLVNAIMKGNIQIPNPVFLNQPIIGTSLPFTQMTEHPENEFPDLMMK